MDAARPSPAPISARRWLRAMYTPRASSTRVRIGSAHLRVFSSRYPCLRLDQVLGGEQGQRRVDVGELGDDREPLVGQVALDHVDERAEVQHHLVVADRDRAIALTRTGPSPTGRAPAVLTCTHNRATCGLATILATWVWMKPYTALASCPEKLFSSAPTRGSPRCVSAPAACVGQPLHIEPGGDLAGDVVREGALDRRVVDERLDVGDVAVGVGHLVGGPHGEHRERREQASHDDEHRRDRAPPAEVGSGGRIPSGRAGARRLELGDLLAQALQFGPLLVEFGPLLGGRPGTPRSRHRQRHAWPRPPPWPGLRPPWPGPRRLSRRPRPPWPGPQPWRRLWPPSPRPQPP